jgi:hypothetical protein
MSGIRQASTPSKYVINKDYANGDKLFSGHIRYQDLVSSMGGTVKDYTDLTEIASSYYSPLSQTLSEGKAPFIEWVKGIGGTKDIDTQKARWRSYGSPKRKFLSMGNVNGAVQNVGAAGSYFKIIFDVDHFQPSDQLAPVENGNVIVVIESYARRAQGGYEYEARLLRDDTFIDKVYLNNKFWCRAGQSSSYFAPLSGRAGSISFDTGFAYIEWEVPLSTMTLEYSVDMETHLKEGSLMVGCKYDDKLVDGKITNRLAIEFARQFDMQMEHTLIHGQMTKHNVDPINRKPITTSPGLYAYLEESNIIKYNPFVNSIDIILDLINSYWYDRVAVNNRNLVLMTGQAGLVLWNDWITEKFGASNVQVQHNFVLGTSKAHDSAKQGYELGGFQFTKYHVQPYGTISVAHWPMLDDTLYDAKTMPGSIYTVRSHEFIAMDWGMGKPNVQLLSNKQRDFDLIEPGYWSPWGAVGTNNPVFKTVGNASLGYSYTGRKSRTFGLKISDVNRLLIFKPAI